ncbi:MAG: V-type ATPase subunit [Candidatus Edwardsbacteria bacterium]|nr:V-type ATPase subunit [Candidatus Edwardsbacteria bacterium]
MPSDYGYINARIKGWHSRLLAAGAYEELLDLPDFAALAKWMETGPYSADWQLARARYDGLEAVEWALESNFSRVTKKLLKISDSGPRRLISVLLRRWDLANLKTVIRGIAQEWSGIEIARSLWPSGALDLVRLKELSEQKNLRAVADILATWQEPFAEPLNGCLPSYERDKDLVPVELALDRFYYRQAFRQLRGIGHDKGLLRGLFRREIDLANAKALRRLAGGPGAPGGTMQYFIEGGKTFTKPLFSGLLDAKQRIRRLRGLRGTAHYLFLAGSGDPVDLENGLDQAFWAACARLYRARPLGVDVVVGFLWQKYYELVNLRLLARAKHYGLPADQVRPQMFLI